MAMGKAPQPRKRIRFPAQPADDLLSTPSTAIYIGERPAYILREVHRMSKTTVEIDDRKVNEVKEVLGTRTLKDTIDRALDAVLAGVARERLVRRLRRMDGLQLDDPAVMESAWR